MHGEDPRWLALSRQVAALSPEAFRAVLDDARGEGARRALYRARFRWRVREFLRFCLPEVFYLPWNDFHVAVLDAPKAHWRDRVGRIERHAEAAPRGIAKTTTAKGLALHDAVYGLEGFTVVLSARHDDAMDWADTLRGWAEHPSDALQWLYGPVRIAGAKERFELRFDGQAPAPFACRSPRTPIRGLNWRSQRPTKVILDDVEDRSRVLNPALRAEDRRWVTDDVLKLGPREGGLRVEWVGTVLHPDAALARQIRAEEPFAGWRGRRWQAVIRWPEGERARSLWERCRRIYTDLTVSTDAGVREAAARAFYEAHRAEMDEGVEVLDPHALPIFRVYQLIWDEGESSVRRELQNDPIDPTSRIFYSDTFWRCRFEPGRDGGTIVTHDGRRVPLARTVRRLWWDPADGGSDTAAMVVMARDDHGYRYVLDAWIRACKLSEQDGPLWALAERWGVQSARAGRGGFRGYDETFRRIRRERADRGQFAALDLRWVDETVNKAEFIVGTLEVPLANGWLQIAEGVPREYLAQFDEFTPDASRRDAIHDDGPDATAKLYADLESFRAPHMGDDRIW